MTRRSGRERRSPTNVEQLPWRRVECPFPPLELLSADQVETIVDAALGILETKGLRFLDADCRRRLAAAGAANDEPTQMVRFDRGLVLERLAHAPREFELRSRNRAHDLHVGGRSVIFGSVGGPAFVNDLDRGRRPGTYAEQCDFLRLVQALEIVHHEGGGPFEAMDLPAESRHLDLYLAQWTLTDKTCQAYALGRERTIDAIEMACLALGVDREELAREPALLAIVNTNSPMQLDVPMGEAVLELAAAGQAVCITPFTLAGSMSPATLAGTLVQQTAEVLAVATLAQVVRPGAPILYGSFASNVDLRSGSPALGTPEYAKCAIASGQIARRLGLPLRSSSTTSSNAVDAQAAYESQVSLWSAILGGAHLVNHAAGWLEGGMTASFEKLIVDAEMLQTMAETLRPIVVDDDQLALDAIAEVPPGGHHFATAHTMARYETAFYAPLLSSRQNFESWQEAGSPDAARRANTIWKRLLADYREPSIDPATRDALAAYVGRRKEAIARR